MRCNGNEEATLNSKELKTIIERHSPHARDRVARTVKQWNQNLREHLRSETGLHFSNASKTTSVSVRLDNGFPDDFASAIKGKGERLELLMTLPALEGGIKGLSALRDNYNRIVAQELNGDTDISLEDVKGIEEFLGKTISNLAKQEFLETLGSIDEDTLGAYFFRKSEVLIYWMPIALYANLLGVTIEALTVITLAHELAHAFTHLGFDIDGENWNTEAFANADRSVCEGLAQWYTAVVCEKLGERHAEILEAYNRDTAIYKDKSPYKVHVTWSDKHKAPKEVIRLVLLKCRKLGLTTYREFEELLAKECAAMPKAVGKQVELFT